MYDKVKMCVCETCGKKFQSEIRFEKGRLHCFIDCPKCRKDKTRYQSCIDVYKELYRGSEG